MSSRRLASINKKMSNECLTSSAIDIDDESMDEDSNSQLNYSQSGTTDDDCRKYRRRKTKQIKITKSHRLIEKRRRDRMNQSLEILLELIPHKKPVSHRRIEKTEIVEMAIKYIQSFISLNKKSFEPIDLNRKSNLKIDAYHCGYHNGIYDVYEYIEKHINNEKFLPDLIDYINQKEVELKDLIVVPEKKSSICISRKSSQPSCDTSKSNDNLRAISDVQTSNNHENFYKFSIDEPQNFIQQTKVPIFVLHPSGTHYIPMCIDSAIVIHAFNTTSNQSEISSINEQPPYHPVSIPVNFSPISALSNSYELDIQNINVIGTRHQTSVRPD